MNSSDILVLVGGVGAIALVNWYFLFSNRTAAAATPTISGQEIRILVKGGYEPGTIRLKRGRPTRLVFDRQERSSCSEEIVLPAFGVRKFLPAFEQTAVDIIPQESGTFDITCGMSMLHGKIVVED
jgi:plastocyanin domain-containing protein